MTGTTDKNLNAHKILLVNHAIQSALFSLLPCVPSEYGSNFIYESIYLYTKTISFFECKIDI